MLSTLAAAATIGFLGSFHCALMCGPLLAAGCARGRRSTGALAYHAGRLASYAFAGALLGQLGARVAHGLASSMVPRVLALVVAALALAQGVRLMIARRATASTSTSTTTTAITTATAPIVLGVRRRRPRLGEWVASMVPRRALPLGLVTGVLPCGLLASGWVLAASTGNPAAGALAMAVFALATAPGLTASLLVTVPALRRRWSPAWQGLSWCVLAIFLALRPLVEHAACCGRR
jgi:sulfite exporter TauE/SafE